MSVAGVDEAGRGALAGPVVVAAVILKDPIEGLADSKQLTRNKRQELYPIILEQALAVSIAIVGRRTIDRLNILHATLYGMRRSIEKLSVYPQQILIDGNRAPKMDRQIETKIKGDQRYPCISAASIIAKVIRDIQMIKYETRYPGYGFAQHKGYGTERHYDALCQLGPCLIHRRGFRLGRQESLFEI